MQGGGHSHHQFGVNSVGFHAIIFTVCLFSRFLQNYKPKFKKWQIKRHVVGISHILVRYLQDLLLTL